MSNPIDSNQALIKSYNENHTSFNMSERRRPIAPGVSQKVAVGAASAQSAALQSGTHIARIYATVACHIKIAANPTAVADGTNMFIPATTEQFIEVTGGYKIAVIRDAGDGYLYITEATNV